MSRAVPLPRPPHRRRRLVAAAAGTLLLWLAAAPPATAQERRPAPPPVPSLADHPGFVDFEALGLDAPGDVTLRVSLHGALLRLVAQATEGDESGFSELVGKLESIQASIFELSGRDAASLRAQTGRLADRLRKRGWETVFELRSDQEVSFIQVRMDGEHVSGLAVMFVDPEGSAGFINVVGDVSPEELGRLGRTFNLEPLEEMDDALERERR